MEIVDRSIQISRKQFHVSRKTKISLIRGIRLYLKEILFYVSDSSVDDVREIMKLYLNKVASPTAKSMHLSTIMKYYG